MTKTGNDFAKEFLRQHTRYETPPGAKANFIFFFALPVVVQFRKDLSRSLPWVFPKGSRWAKNLFRS